ncbi:hypothetical protein Golob_017728 [Gossypium lobatum]|uniref:Uncharacterized protein n=1 Tax=Gossypium lobatum TaxID=34289 RepID=A0A7J8M8J1_9ROSI|nr:hypothetical protein [Gossypium lobatum]
METCGSSKKNIRSKDMLSTLEGRVTNLEESMDGVKETLKVVEGCTDELDPMRMQLRDNMVIRPRKKIEKNDTLKVMVVALKEKTKAMMARIDELEEELTMYRVAIGKGMLASVPKKPRIDVPKLKEFQGM